MRNEEFIFKDPEGQEIFTYKWTPDNFANIKAIVQISHGMAEHAGRYERFANVLTGAGYLVYANDHRGHGKTAKTDDNLGIVADKNSFRMLIDDMFQLTGIIKEQNRGLPVFLFGHSLGSLLLQGYLSLYGGGINGAILSSTTGKAGPEIYAGILLSGLEVFRKGRNVKSPLMNQMTFGKYNDFFKPNRTKFDWLSRDENEVDKYIKDPYCGKVFTAGFFYDLTAGLKWLHRKDTMAGIPENIPVYLFSGDKDPLGRQTKGVYQLIGMYKKLGLKNVTFKFYKDGRHESLNEINRNEVMKDVVSWLDRNIHSF